MIENITESLMNLDTESLYNLPIFERIAYEIPFSVISSWKQTLETCTDLEATESLISSCIRWLQYHTTFLHQTSEITDTDEELLSSFEELIISNKSYKIMSQIFGNSKENWQSKLITRRGPQIIPIMFEMGVLPDNKCLDNLVISGNNPAIIEYSWCLAPNNRPVISLEAIPELLANGSLSDQQIYDTLLTLKQTRLIPYKITRLINMLENAGTINSFSRENIEK